MPFFIVCGKIFFIAVLLLNKGRCPVIQQAAWGVSPLGFQWGDFKPLLKDVDVTRRFRGGDILRLL